MPGDVEVHEGLSPAVALAGPRERVSRRPGFVDLQVNGFGGVDFLDAGSADYRRAGDALLETGVTAYLPTLITSPRTSCSRRCGRCPSATTGPRILGVHLEGPFLSPTGSDARASARRDPDPALLDRLLDAGTVRLMTLAPELPGADALIDRLLERGVAVSLGHSDATAEQANAAFDRGVALRHAPLQRDAALPAPRPGHHRRRAHARRRHRLVILDGIHLAPETLARAWRAAAGRVALISDAITAAGVADGSFSFGNLDVAGHEGAVRGPTACSQAAC